jgi:hypothetical protein
MPEMEYNYLSEWIRTLVFIALSALVLVFALRWTELLCHAFTDRALAGLVMLVLTVMCVMVVMLFAGAWLGL